MNERDIVRMRSARLVVIALEMAGIDDKVQHRE